MDTSEGLRPLSQVFPPAVQLGAPGCASRVFRGASSLLALAHWVPHEVQTTKYLEGQIKAFRGSKLGLELRTGLRQVRRCAPDTAVIDVAMRAVEELLRRGKWNADPISLDEVDLIIYFGVTRAYEEPATATLIQKRLGLSGQIAFDLTDACLGFTDAWCVADSMIASGRVRKALLVGAEVTSIIIGKAVEILNEGGDPKGQFASLTLGDGAAAALVGRRATDSKRINLLGGIRATFGEHSNLCTMRSFHEGMTSNPTPMFEAALKHSVPMIRTLLSALDWHTSSVDMFVSHQASVPVVAKGAQILEVPFEKWMLSFPEYGNTASVAVPLTISLSADRLGEWDRKRIVTVGFGSGLGVGVFGLETCAGQPPQ